MFLNIYKKATCPFLRETKRFFFLNYRCSVCLPSFSYHPLKTRSFIDSLDFSVVFPNLLLSFIRYSNFFILFFHLNINQD